MPDRPAKFVLAIFASVVAGTSLASLPHNAARAADDCLTAPKGETPEGSHWYYRIERGTKRHCWYLRTEGETLSQTAAPDSAGSAKPAASTAAPMQRSLADARAELPAQLGIEPSRGNDGQAPAASADPAPSASSAPVADPQQSVVASRWLDPADMTSSVRARPATEQPTEQTAANVPAAASQAADAPSDPATAPPPAAAAVPLAAADSSQALPASLPMLLGVMTGALILAGITASLVLKFGGARRSAGGRVRRDRIWDSIDRDGVGSSAHPDAGVIPRRPHFPRDLDQAAEPDDRVAAFYAQISKQARG